MILYFDLQLFSEEKTEQPTSKKIRDARNKGQVVQSKELSSAVALLTVFVAFYAFSGYIVSEVFNFYYLCMNLIDETDQFFTTAGVQAFLNETLLFILKMSLPALGVALVSGVLMSYIQVGFLFTTETIKPKLEKINPAKGFKNMFSSRALVELLKSVLKAIFIVYISFTYLQDHLFELITTLELGIGQTIQVLWSLVFGMILRSALFLFVIAIFDFAFKRWKNNKDLMMTKQEIKDEYKQSEGDPQLKSRIKQKQRQMAMSRMMQEVPKADVVITNPTHFAVALKYDASVGDAPVVVAKGQDLVAQNIKAVATENEVPIVENKPLAQTLYKDVKIGAFIPQELYEAVAEVLAYVYTLKKDA
ncbi:MAG: flagellar biosynthesis protein FlhB [Clostridiales bacterium]|jgi:flagellar biosynthetic protein FlhB|nr:flagellar biosynthesis protein FlhB [Clostridiales bacterium]